MKVYERVAETLWTLGVRQVFGVAGSGNYRVIRELVRHGANYVSARHEGGAMSMGDGFARVGGSVPVVSVHQGGGLTNIVTGLTEAAKSGSPLLVLAGEAPADDRVSNFRIDQASLVESVGAVSMRIHQKSATDDVRQALRTARLRRVPVVLNFPVDVQVTDSPESGPVAPLPDPQPVAPAPQYVDKIAELLLDAHAPLIIGGRGARNGVAELRELAERCGALLATSAVGRGLFYDDPFSLDVMGDLASPITAELVLRSDVIVAFGASLNRWTTSNGTLLPSVATVVQVDIDPVALGDRYAVDLGVVGDTAVTAAAITERIPKMVELSSRRRTETTRKRIAEQVRWRDVPFRDTGTDDRIDPRTATITLDRILDSARNVAVDSGNFLGYPTMFLTVTDPWALCFSQAFQCVGLGLGSAIGHAIARPDRLTVCGTGDGGLLMAASELETVARLKLPIVIVVYNDSAYGAEIHHFGRTEYDEGFVTFPDVDFASIAAGYGLTGVTVRSEADFTDVQKWVDGPRDRALLVDLKVTTNEPSWWLADAFKAES